MTTWVLLIFFYVDRGAAFDSIQGLKDQRECQRVAAVVKETLDRGGIITRCIEVINK